MKTKYFLYARKSTEDEERQVMSIEAQLAELAEIFTPSRGRVCCSQRFELAPASRLNTGVPNTGSVLISTVK